MEELVLDVKREDSLKMRNLASNRGTDENHKRQKIYSILSQKGEMNAIIRTWVQHKQIDTF